MDTTELIFITETKKKLLRLDYMQLLLGLSYGLFNYRKTILKSVEE
jgi:hypothetical protein